MESWGRRREMLILVLVLPTTAISVWADDGPAPSFHCIIHPGRHYDVMPC